MDEHQEGAEIDLARLAEPFAENRQAVLVDNSCLCCVLWDFIAAGKSMESHPGI